MWKNPSHLSSIICLTSCQRIYKTYGNFFNILPASTCLNHPHQSFHSLSTHKHMRLLKKNTGDIFNTMKHWGPLPDVWNEHKRATLLIYRYREINYRQHLKNLFAAFQAVSKIPLRFISRLSEDQAFVALS